MERGRGIASTPLRIVLVYVVVGAAWILFSDRAVSALPEARARQAQTLKGGVYVAVTAALLYALMRRHLREKETLGAHLRTVLDAMTDAAFVVDRDGRVVGANDTAVALAGAASRAEILGPLDDVLRRIQLVGGDGQPITFAHSASRRALQGETVTGYEARVRRGDEELTIAVSSAPLAHADRTARPLALTVLRDRTAEKRFEQTREEFLATAAHEFKTPLAVVKAYAQLMERRGEGDRAALLVIERQVDRLTRMVQQILEASRFRIGGGELHRERFDLGALVAEVVDALRARAADPPIALASDEPSPVMADRARIAQVLRELLDNALRFSPRGGEVEARVDRKGAEAVVSIRDRGLGIAPDRQSRIFEDYYRAHAGTPDDYGGLGVGLGLCREIVARHGGRIGFDSRPGVGSTFWFSLPRAAEAGT